MTKELKFTCREGISVVKDKDGKIIKKGMVTKRPPLKKTVVKKEKK